MGDGEWFDCSDLIPRLAVSTHTLERGADVWVEGRLCLLWIDLLVHLHATVFAGGRVVFPQRPLGIYISIFDSTTLSLYTHRSTLCWLHDSADHK